MRCSLGLVIACTVCAACGDPQLAQPDAPPVDAPAPDASALALTTIPLVGCGYSYTGEIAIGGRPFRVSIDTGSPTLAVAGAGCTTCAAGGVTSFYTPGPSA